VDYTYQSPQYIAIDIGLDINIDTYKSS